MKDEFDKQRQRDARAHSPEFQEQLNRVLFSAIAAALGEEVSAALEGGADINAYDADGNTPLLAAIKTGRTDMALLLIKQGADTSLPDKDGWVPLIWAAYKEKTDIVEALAAHKADLEARTPGSEETALIIAVEHRYEGVAVHLVRAGADPNAMAKDQDQPLLMTAMESGKEILMRDLVKYGADLTARNKDGVTPLALARQYGKTDLVEMIAERTHKRHTNKVKSAFMRRRGARHA